MEGEAPWCGLEESPLAWSRGEPQGVGGGLGVSILYCRKLHGSLHH